MSGGTWGALVGLVAGLGLLVVAARIRAIRRAPLAIRVLPYLRGVSDLSDPVRGSDAPRAWLRLAGDGWGRLIGGASAIERRLERAGSPLSVRGYRAEQVLWGLVGVTATAVLGLVRQVSHPVTPGGVTAWLLACAVAGVAGLVCRDSRLSAQVAARERRMVAEFPVVAELLALAVAAGESPVAALHRVVARGTGPLTTELGRVLAAVRAGETAAAAFDRLAARTGLPVLARFAAGVATAVERGTPLADVLHAQAADVREAGRRALIEAGARREVAMLAPIVFLVLPVIVLFALYPGLVALHLTT